ncbi:tape measure protein [Pseudomonas sp. CC6-YY-74]|uniref:tape measure protein n=1 Tax=Pseudomonas sp. CC6-YY-74 TaxID=1930532 RepID=UPI0009A20579|nr:tape measure protein [Pseudomonas sp. CC6-YY-74]
MAGIKDRLIQFILRGKDELSPEAKKSAAALESLREEAEGLGKALDSAKESRGLAKALEATQRTVEQSQRSLEQTEQRVTDLRQALSESPEAAGLQQSLKEAEREASRTRKQLLNLNTALADQEKAAKAAGIDTNKLADEEQRLANEVERAKRALADNGQQLKALQREQSAASRTAAEHNSRIAAGREVMSRGAKQVLAFAAAYISLNAAFGLVQKGLNIVRDGIYSMLQTGDQFELLDKRLVSLMGSIAGGEQAAAWIKDFAKNTPLEVADVTEAFALLKTYGLDPLDGTLQAVVDKNEQLGGGMERLTGIASALGQAYGKQKLQTEEILQLVERGVPVWALLEKVTGKTSAQLETLATKGKLGRDVIKALIAEIAKSSEGAAADAMGTLTGRVSNLSDVWSDFLDRISKSGAMDFVKKKLGEVAAKIDEMDKDGRLDELAQSLSDTFVNGAESIEKWIKKLGEVDLNELAEKAAAMAKKVGPAIDQALTAGQYVTGTLTTVWNAFSIVVTSSAATLAKGVQLTLGNVLLAGGQIAGFFGGSKIKAEAEALYTALGDLSAGYVAQAKTDLGQIGSAWDFLDEKKGSSTKKQTAAEAEKTAAVKTALEQQRMLNQAHADQLVGDQQRVVDAAASGKTAITDMANAVNLIGDAKSLQQVEGLRSALLKAYQDGTLSLEQYQQGTALLGDKLKTLGTAAGGAADLVSDLDEKLGDLAQVQAAISAAKTDVDINAIRAALKKLYSDGEITAKQYNEELKKTSDRQKELKTTIDGSKKAQDEKNDSDKEAIKTSEELRRESGKRMEQERRAGDQAMQDRRKGSEEAQRDMSAFSDFFGGVISRAREPLAALSAAALAAYDKLRGVTTVDLSMDTSGLEATTRSLEKAREELGKLQAQANTVGISSLGRWMTQSQVQSQQVQVQYLAQKATLQRLMEGYEDGSITLEQFVRRAGSASGSLNLLNDSDLSTLDGALEAAKQRMEQLGDSTRGTLAGLQMELLQLQGTQEEIERARFASRRDELRAQQAQAQTAGDSGAASNLRKALQTLDEIEAATANKRLQDAQQKRSEEAAKAAPAQAQLPTKVIRLETARGQAVNVALQNDRDETNLLSILQDAGLRSL